LLVLVAAALRLVDLGDGLWYDEITTLVHYVRLPVRSILTTFDSQNQHALYSVVARVSVQLFGEGAWALRLPAALFGVASIWAVYWFGRHVTGLRESVLAATFLTLSYHHVWFSQNARGYSGLLFFTLLSTGLLLRLLRHRSPDRVGLVIGYGLSAALAVYMHLTAVFVVLAHGVVWAFLAWRERHRCDGLARWRTAYALVLAATLSVQLYALVLPQVVATVLAPTMPGVETEWTKPSWMVMEILQGLSRGIPGGIGVAAVGAAVVAAGVVSYGRQQWVLVGLMGLPAIGLTAALLATQHNLWPRMLLFTAGFAALILMRGITVVFGAVPRVGGERLATAGAVFLLAVSASTVPTAWNPKQDFGGARAYIERERGPDDAVVTVDMTEIPYRDYMRLDWPAVSHIGELEAIERMHPRTWIVYTFPDRLAGVHEDIWGRLSHDYTPVSQFPGTVEGGAVVIRMRETIQTSEGG
jgi:hypothetical protein